jgi:urease accessory protein UreH
VSAPTGTLQLAARSEAGRTVLERVKYDGISRCSRAFAVGEAAQIVLSQLGPGVVRGDSVTTYGEVGAGAHLIVTSQTATRLMGGSRAAHAQATWTLGEDAVLELIGEPLVANVGALYAGFTTIELGARAVALITEIAQVPAGTDVRLTTSVRRAGLELYYDAIDAAAAAPHVIGSLALLGLDTAAIPRIVTALDRSAGDAGNVRAGVGELPNGVFCRLTALDAWTVGSTLRDLRTAVWAAYGQTFGKPRT